MAKKLSENIFPRFDHKNINDLESVLVERKFGRPEDYIELSILNLRGDVIQSIPNFTGYTSPQGGDLTNELNFDPQQILTSLGYATGVFRLQFNIQKRKIFNIEIPPFIVKEISSTRRELKIYSTIFSNTQLENDSFRFIREVQTSPYFRDFVLNFGNNINEIGVNIDINTEDPDQYYLLIKTYKSLPENIEVGDKLSIVEDIIEPIVLDYDLGELPITDNTIALRGPNFKIDTRLNTSLPTAFKSYDDILNTENTSSYQKLISKLDGYEIPEIEYDYVRPIDTASDAFKAVSPSHFENFVHFGSAVERLNSFEYKLKLIELYDTQLQEVLQISGSTNQSLEIKNVTSSINLKKEKLIQGFDGYEQFLYYTTGSNPYTWPKTTATEPYTLAHTTSSEVETWFGSGDSRNPFYGGQMLSASTFDSQNQNRLFKIIPHFIGDNPDNDPFLLFCDMVGNHFDPIWAHIKEISQIRNNEHKFGVSKNLVYYALKTLGIESYDQFENENLTSYIFGNVVEGGTTNVITGSNEIFSKEDATKEVWKRLYHNAPYLLKTKGTERGLRALINCYGIPSTILDIKEFGSSNPDRDEFKLYSYDKYNKVLAGNSQDHEGFFIETNWSSSAVAALSASEKTVEFRVKPIRSNEPYHLFTLSGSVSSSDLHLLAHPYTGSHDFFHPDDKTQYGRLELHQFTSSISQSTGVGHIISPIELSNTSTSAVGYGASSTINTENSITWTATTGTEGGTVVASTELVAGKSYQVKATVENYVAGDGGDDIGFLTTPVGTTARRNDDGEISHTFTYPGAGSIGVFCRDGASGTLSNISVKEVLIPEGGYFPLYNGEFWDIYLNTDGASGSNATLGFGAYQSNYLREVFAYTSSVSITEKENAEAFGNPFYNGGDNIIGSEKCYFCGIRDFVQNQQVSQSNYSVANSGSAFGLEYSGSLSEVRFYFGERLSHKTLTNHALEPLMYDGNSISSSFNHLVLRFPLSFELELDHDTSTQLPSASALWNDSPTDLTGLITPASNVGPGTTLQGLLTGGAVLSSSLDPFQTTSSLTTYSGQPFGIGSVPSGPPTYTVAGTPLLQSHHPNEDIEYLNGFTYMGPDQIEPVVELHHLPTPNTIGKSAVNRKIYIDSGSTDDDILSPDILSQLPTTQRQVPDFDHLGVFFSPQNELNEDIIYTLGTFSLDETLGDPREQTSSKYQDLTELSQQYFKKLGKSKHNSTFDFIRWIQFTDHTLFEMIKQFTPQKANLKAGLLIEPHYLERSKFKRSHPITQHTFSPTSSLYEATIREIDRPLSASFKQGNYNGKRIGFNNISALDATTGSAVISHTISSSNKNINTVFSIDKQFTGSSAWEQGPLLPTTSNSNLNSSKASLFLDFSNNTGEGMFITLTSADGTVRTYKAADTSSPSITHGTVLADGSIAFNGLGDNDTKGNSLRTAILSDNGHGGKLTVSTVNNLGKFIITQTIPGTVGNTLVTQGFTSGVNDFDFLLNTGGKVRNFEGGGLPKVPRFRVSSGSNELRSALTLYGNFMNSRVSKKIRKSLFENNTIKLVDSSLGNLQSQFNAGTNITINNNTIVFTNVSQGQKANVNLENYPITIGRKYKLTYTISGYSGTGDLLPQLINNNKRKAFTTRTGNGTFIETVIFDGIDNTGNNGNRFYFESTDGSNNFTGTISNVLLEEINPQRDVEFDDSLLGMKSWKNSRYLGSRLIGSKINEYTVGDTTYGLNPVAEQNSSVLYFGKTIIGADGEDDDLVTVKNHSYISIEKMIVIDKSTDKITVLEPKNETYEGMNRYISKDLGPGSSFHIELLDEGISNKLKNKYTSKFSQGYLYKVLEHKGVNGEGSVSQQGIQVGYVDTSTEPFPYKSTDLNVFSYAKDNNIINSNTIVLKQNTLTKKIFPNFQSFGKIDFITGSATNNYYDSVDNLSMFINSMLIPVASESQHRLFGTFNLGQPIAAADYTIEANKGIKSISTVEFDLESYVVTSSLHDQISGSGNMKGFGKPLVRPDHTIIPIMRGPHDVITDKKVGDNLTWPGNGGNTGTSHSGATDVQLQFYFGGDSHINAIYQISYLEESQVIIADIDKPFELANDVGDKGYIIIPDNLDTEIRDNLDFYLEQSGYKEIKIPKDKEDKVPPRNG